MIPSPSPRPRRAPDPLAAASMIAAALACAAPAALFGCASDGHNVPVISSIGDPAIAVQNDLAIPVRVTLWSSTRSLKYEDTWKNMLGRTERIDPGDRASFVMRDAKATSEPVIRIQVETRGPTFDKPDITWFEVLSKPPFIAKLTGTPPRVRLDCDNARLVAIPADRVIDANRRAVVSADPKTVITTH